MLSPWLLLLTVARAAVVSSGHSPEAPSCRQLRALWEAVGRMSSVGQVVKNEIPVMPGGLLLAALSNGRRTKDSVYNHPDLVDDTFPGNPPYTAPLLPPDRDGDGMFGEFHKQSSLPGRFGFLSAVPSEAKKNGKTEFYVPRWGSPEEVDTFGSFLDLDLGSPQLAMTRTPKNLAGEWTVAKPVSSQVTCDVRTNTNCASSEQCLCKGWRKLACMRGKCVDLDQDTGDKYGTWHDGPVPRTQLRLIPRRYESIFM